MSKNPVFWLSVFLLACAGVQAEEAAVPAVRQSAKVVSYADVLQWLFALLIVLAIFGGLVWLLRKSGNLTFANKSQLAVVAGLSLGMRERLVLVKVGEKQLLLGVTHGRMEKLMVLEGDQRIFLEPENSNELGLFAQKLKQVMQGKANA
jgi:flagellar protein FliO/FliZ